MDGLILSGVITYFRSLNESNFLLFIETKRTQTIFFPFINPN